MSAMPHLPAPNEPDRPRPLVAARVSQEIEPSPTPAPPHPLGPLRPALIRWPIVLLFVAAFAGGAYYVGTTRSPTFTATSTINVGRTDVRVQALPGYVEGAKALAASYSRVVSSDEIIGPVAKRLKLTPDQVRSHISATPIAGAPIFTISATGPDEASAVALADAATREMRRFVTRTDDGDTSSRSLMADYRAQARRAATLEREVQRLRANLRNGVGDADETRSRLLRAQTDQDTAELRKQSLQSLYVNQMATDTSTAGIQVLSPATSGQSDRDSMLQKLIVVGALAGLVVGLAVAAMFGRRSRRRRRIPT
jgi:capsular polysaccharide biosynthesis protein